MLKLLPILLLLVPSSTKSLTEDEKKVINNFIEVTKEYSSSVEKEFNNLRTNERDDTEITEVEAGDDYKVVEVKIPVKQPFIKLNNKGLLELEIKDTKPIIRRVVAELKDGKVKVELHRTGIFFQFGIDIGIALASSTKERVQPLLAATFVHFSNEYMRISAGGFAGIERYGVGLLFGPSFTLSNVRLLVGYSRPYSYKENFIEVGVTAGVFFK